MKPAAAYYRMSSDRQEASVPDQRKAVAKYAADHGYRIVAEYVDEGVSGDATNRRTGFLRMLSDAPAAEWRVILCWDQDRFGRFDPIEGGYWIKPLRDAGVRLETIAQGVIDWTDFAGRIVWSVQQEAKHAYLRDLSRNVLRGMIERAKAGTLKTRAPFGYRWDGDSFVPSDDAPIAAKAFRDYLAGKSLRDLCRDLPPRNGVPWTPPGVKIMLANPVYKGDRVWGRKKVGRYHRFLDGNIERADRHGGGYITVANGHEAIVSAAVWDEVQRQLKARRKKTSPKKSYLLSYLVRCGHCGGVCYGHRWQGDERYRCRSAGCRSYEVREEWLAAQVLAVLAERIGTPAAQARWRKLIGQKARQKFDPKPLEKRLAALDQAVVAGARRLLSVSDAVAPAVEEELRRIQGERDAVSAQLAEARASQARSGSAATERINAVAAMASDVNAMLAVPTPSRLAALFAAAVESVTVTWESRRAGKALRHAVREIRVAVRPFDDFGVL